jgi:dihydropteroate synthase
VGFGFAKKMEHNLELLRELSHWKTAIGNYALVVGTSRKGFIGRLVQEEDPSRREFGTGEPDPPIP